MEGKKGERDRPPHAGERASEASRGNIYTVHHGTPKILLHAGGRWTVINQQQGVAKNEGHSRKSSITFLKNEKKQKTKTLKPHLVTCEK